MRYDPGSMSFMAKCPDESEVVANCCGSVAPGARESCCLTLVGVSVTVAFLTGSPVNASRMWPSSVAKSPGLAAGWVWPLLDGAVNQRDVARIQMVEKRIIFSSIAICNYYIANCNYRQAVF